MLNQKNYDFSFSGLKTAVLYYLRNEFKAASEYFHSAALRPSGHGFPRSGESEAEAPVSELAGRANGSEKIFTRCLPDIAASFQQAAFDVLILKTLRAAEEFNANSIFISGGVASNNSLRNYLKSKIKNQKSKLNVFFPAKNFCTDNAAMIAVAGYIDYIKGKKRRLIAKGNLSL